MRFDTISNLFKLVKTCQNLFKLVQNYNMTKFYQIWCNSTQLTCPDLSKCNDMIYNDSTNMFRLDLWCDLTVFYKHVQTCFEVLKAFCEIHQLWCDLIGFYKHVQTCFRFLKTCFKVPKTLMWFDTILQTCSDLSKIATWWNTMIFR